MSGKHWIFSREMILHSEREDISGLSRRLFLVWGSPIWICMSNDCGKNIRYLIWSLQTVLTLLLLDQSKNFLFLLIIIGNFKQVHVTVGNHRVHFRETITQQAEFDYLLEKKRAGILEYARVIGYVEPLPPNSKEKFEFHSMIARQALPLRSIGAIERGFKEAVKSGSLIGHPVENLRIVLTGGASQALDCGKEALKTAAIDAFRDCYAAARPVILEPVMLVELKVPTEFQATVAGDINRRECTIVGY